LGAGGTGDAFLVAEVEKVLAQFLVAELIRWFAVMAGELLDSLVLNVNCLCR
jgi:hypothetical protein